MAAGRMIATISWQLGYMVNLSSLKARPGLVISKSLLETSAYNHYCIKQIRPALHNKFRPAWFNFYSAAPPLPVGVRYWKGLRAEICWGDQPAGAMLLLVPWERCALRVWCALLLVPWEWYALRVWCAFSAVVCYK